MVSSLSCPIIKPTKKNKFDDFKSRKIKKNLENGLGKEINLVKSKNRGEIPAYIYARLDQTSS